MSPGREAATSWFTKALQTEQALNVFDLHIVRFREERD